MMISRRGRAKHDTLGAPRRRPEALRFELLGGFRVWVGTRVIEEGEWRLKKAADLVKLLALAPGRRMHREQVAGLLWPDLDRGAADNNVYQALHVARRALDPNPVAASHYLRLRRDLLVLCPDAPLWVDVEAFEETASVTFQSLEPAAYRAALDLYAGELLPGNRYEAWAEERREGLRETYLALLLKLAKLYEERGGVEEAVEALRRVLVTEPAREEAHAGLMRLYAVSGRRGEALGQYERLRRVLSREFAAEPAAASRRLHEEIVEGRLPPAPRSLRGGRALEECPGLGGHNLPAARTSFVGREREMLEVKRALAMTRLLTLTGAGGSGKTRLALEVARDLVGAYPDGVWMVELASLSEPVSQAVASALGVREQPGRPLTAALTDSLRSKRLLLVLDNCEHLIDACAGFVDMVLASCPHVRILATSREALGVAGELNWRIPCLSLPDADRPPYVESLTRYEAVRLFVERARSRLPTFTPTPGNARAIVEVSRKLEGMPLAIELATAWVPTLTVEQIAERLRDPLGLLTSGNRTAAPRHQTLRATLEWSYDLLGEAEQRLLRRLSVFAGGWTLEAAEAVGGGEGIEEGDVLELLWKLVNKSLVVTETGTERTVRYRMLEPVRQYGRERLQENGEEEQGLRRHAAFFLALAEQAEPELRGLRQAQWLERLDGEQHNLRAAMTWLLRNKDLETAVRLGWALSRFWWIRGRFADGRRWMEGTLTNGAGMPAHTRARALFVAGTLANGQADYRSAAALLEESLELFRGLEDKLGAAYVLSSAGFAAIGQAQHEKGIALLEEAVGLSLEVGEKWGAAYMLCFLATVWRSRGNHGRAKRLAERALALSREAGDKQGISIALYLLAGLAQVERDHEQATRLFEEGLELSTEVGDETNVAYCLEGLATVAALEGKVVRAARLWGTAEAILSRIEVAGYIYAPDRTLYQSQAVAAREALGEEAFKAVWAEGRTMTSEEAVEYALSKEEPTPTTIAALPGRPSVDNLTRREEEVAVLVAQGLTNRRIASELTLSKRTVDNHVRNILKKLKLPSRAHVAVWVKQPRHEVGPVQES